MFTGPTHSRNAYVDCKRSFVSRCCTLVLCLVPWHISRSTGTHFMWEMLNRLGVDVHHEGVGRDGAVSWLFAYKYVVLRLTAVTYPI